MSETVLFLVLAVLIGAASGAVASGRRDGGWLDLGFGAATFAAFALPAMLFAGSVAGFFGLVHQVYVLAVVGVPIAAIVTVVVRRVRDNPKARLGLVAVALIGLVAAGGGIWASFIEPNRLELRGDTVAVSGVRDPIVVGVIADLQTPSVGDHERAAVDRVLAQEPDLVLMPGDLFQLRPDDVEKRYEEFVELLEVLTAGVDQVVIIDGDVDFPGVVREMADDAGAVFLSDEVRAFDIDGQVVNIAGLRTKGGSQRTQINPLVAAEIDAFGPDDIVILLSHPPDPVLGLPDGSPVDLTIAGHTHGGQVAVPFVGPLVTFSSVPRDSAAGGLTVVNGHQLYVSAGVGAERGSAPVVRFGVPPEVGILTLVPG